jgi:hypothetical protein
MKRLFNYVTKKQNDSTFVKSENEEFIAANISYGHQ